MPFVRTDKGYITLNGIELTKYDRAEYQRILAVVFQDFKLFSFSVAENVATNRLPDMLRVKAALEIAGVREQVKLMPGYTDAILTKHLDEQGVEVSGGEAQKIAIARAWYKNAPFVILDEPTSALDPMAEYDIYKHFDDLIEDKTAIYISHRMSSARFSQRIIVFDKGTVVQEGTHDSLMATKSGRYYDLFTAQAKYYTEEYEADAQLEELFSY
nr:ABC transporter ATP-binding protein [uncultured Vagococcus sp.]